MNLQSKIINMPIDHEEIGMYNLREQKIYRLGHQTARHGAAKLLDESEYNINLYRKGHERYEKLRKLRAPQFEELELRAMNGENFDAMVDALK